MKSLEYVKKIREDLNQCFRHGNPATMNNEHEIYHHEWETIKHDLEVLEIIKNNRVDVGTLLHILRNWKNEPDYMITAVYNDRCWGEQYALSKEEINKLKQWLEENYD